MNNYTGYIFRTDEETKIQKCIEDDVNKIDKKEKENEDP